MSKLLKNKAFLVGFITGILIFAGINFYSFQPKYNPPTFDSGETSGFPLSWYQSGTATIVSNKSWEYLIIDVLLAIIFSLILGLIFKFVWAKIS